MDLSMPVLVVDDYNTMIRIIRNLLKQIGFADIDDAVDGSSALGKMREKRYGLVISDWCIRPPCAKCKIRIWRKKWCRTCFSHWRGKRRPWGRTPLCPRGCTALPTTQPKTSLEPNAAASRLLHNASRTVARNPCPNRLNTQPPRSAS